MTLNVKSLNPLCRPQSGKFGSTSSDVHENQGIQSAEEAAEHESMKAVLKSGLRVGDSGTSTLPGLRMRTRASNSRGRSPYLDPLGQLMLSKKVEVQQCLQQR